MFIASLIVVGLSLSPLFNESMSNQEIASLIDDYAQRYVMRFTPSAIIQVNRNGHSIYSKSFGYSNIEESILSTPEDIYEWGSITKTITFAAVMMLEEDGYLDLNTDVEDYVGKGFLKKKKYSDPITILHLMHHSAGFDETVLGNEFVDPSTVPSIKDYLQKYEPNQFARPGEVVAYSNYGVALAGYIIEVCSNMTYQKYVKTRIFDRLGMSHSTVDPAFSDNPYVKEHKKAIGYYVTDKFIRYPKQNSAIGPYPAGSGVGPATDLIKFADALLGKTPLFRKTSTLQRFLSISDRAADGVPGVAHGFWELFFEDTNGLEHSGNTFAFTSKLIITKAGEISIVVLANLMGENILCTGVPRLLLGFGHPSLYKKPLPDVSTFNGYYYSARGINTGFMSLEYRLQGLTEFKKTGPLLQAGPVNYTQIRPGFFFATNNAFARPFMYANYDGDQVKSMSTFITTMIRVSSSGYRWMKFSRFLFPFFQWTGLVSFISVFGIFFYKYIRNKKINIDFEFTVEALSSISCLFIFFEIYCYNSAIEAASTIFTDWSVFDKYTTPSLCLMLVRCLMLGFIIVFVVYIKVFPRIFVVGRGLLSHDLIESSEVEIVTSKCPTVSIVYVTICSFLSVLTSALGLIWSIYW